MNQHIPTGGYPANSMATIVAGIETDISKTTTESVLSQKHHPLASEDKAIEDIQTKCLVLPGVKLVNAEDIGLDTVRKSAKELTLMAAMGAAMSGMPPGMAEAFGRPPRMPQGSKTYLKEELTPIERMKRNMAVQTHNALVDKKKAEKQAKKKLKAMKQEITDAVK